MKKVLSIVMAIMLLAALLSGCGNTASPAANEAADAAPAENTSSAQATADEPIKMRIGITIAPLETDYEYLSTVMFADLINEYSEGRIEAEVYPSSQLGGTLEEAEMQSLGTLECTVTGFDTYSNFDPIFNVVVQPYMFRDMDHVRLFFESDNDAIAVLKQHMIDSANARVVGFQYRPMRSIGTKSTPIYSVEDFKGLDSRAPQVLAVTNWYTALGATPVSISWNEVYTGITNGTLSAADNAVTTIVNGNMQDILGYINETQHLMVSLTVTVCNSWFESLDADLQDAILRAGAESTAWNWDQMQVAEEEAWATAAEAGCVCIRADQIDIESIKEAGKDLYKQYIKQGDFTEELYDSIVNLA